MDIFFFTVLERDVGRRNFNRDFGWGGKLIKKKEKGLAKKKHVSFVKMTSFQTLYNGDTIPVLGCKFYVYLNIKAVT